MTGKTLMVQGTSSSVGKSWLTAALCRIFARRGISVAPFKSQNMSNNAAVCPDGSEIGRSQAVQSAAAGISPTADVNPVLLKPEAAARSQVIVQGRPWLTLPAHDYHRNREQLWSIVCQSLERLRSDFELVVIEGAGGAAELNLREVEIANMAVARHARSPVILVGDIERGGVFAQLLGTLWLLSDEERALVRGLIVNKFRGDPGLFTEGVRQLEERGGVPVLGVIPWADNLEIPEEDSVALDQQRAPTPAPTELDIAVVRLPHIANFDDFDPLGAEAGVSLRYVDHRKALGRPDAVILPGTKSTIDDLSWLRRAGLADALIDLASTGTPIVGICGGYQMLGLTIKDPQQIESSTPESLGLGLLPSRTRFKATKYTHCVRATASCEWLPEDRIEIEGYEIHMADTSGSRPWIQITQRSGERVEVGDGAISPDGKIWGCYLHGLFGNVEFRRAWLRSLGATGWSAVDQQPTLDSSLDRLADHVEAAIDVQQLETIVWGQPSR